ncbi:MAG: hypothetical protein M3Y13_04230, partial [Armatimonadota bacterium]|nr:hypothetical protein [Armatimonadota bacterium]
AQRTGDEQFSPQTLMPLMLLDFWRWSASDLVSNATRGILAEFIVASALGVAGGVRAEWDAFDLLTPSGLKVEVKSASYLQSWYHRKLSPITFGIRPTRLVDTDTNVVSSELRRQADVYVFCLLAHKDKATVDPLDLSQWAFYVLPASVLDDKLPGQKTLALSRLLTLNPAAVSYNELASAVEACRSRVTIP